MRKRRVAATDAADMVTSREWAKRFFSTAADVPISFRLDGKEIQGIPADWSPAVSRHRIDANIVQTAFNGHDVRTGLAIRVECTQYLDYPVVEWAAWLTNTADRPTPIISDILALSSAFEGGSPVLWHCNGDFSNVAGYTEEQTPLAAGLALRFAPTDGRPCNRAWPYYRLAFGGCGMTLAIGWPGQWSATFTRTAEGVHIAAGQELTHLRLMPGETVRTPRITLMAWAGDSDCAVNLWRRWYRDHLLPRPDGRPLQPLVAGLGADEGEEHTGVSEDNQLRYMERWFKQDIPVDVWWMDAGWYSCRDEQGVNRWKHVGTWTPDPVRFPNGLKPVSAAAAAHGAKLLIWFEPERVHVTSQIYAEHPEWTLATQHPDPWIAPGESALWIDGSRLLDLGNPACRRWVTEHLCASIREHGIKIYRQDFNINPLSYWRENDVADRQGMRENLHVQGYLQLWDDLLARNPGLWIDSCASGGRRNDLETLRRSVPLHYSDYGYGHNPVKSAFHHVLFQWMPYFKDGTLSWDLGDKVAPGQVVDSYSFHCGLAPMIFPAIDIRKDGYDFALLRKMLGIWRRAAELMVNGDYYLLAPAHRTPDKWVAWQFDCPEAGRGFVQGIRHPACPEETLVVHPRAVCPEAVYVFENSETGETRELAGSAVLANGFTFALPKRQGAIWFYHERV
ncbi:MAG: alpha-galactosidase [Phycisphaerae bacterium]|nr:alpha-galactosidase [Phycisphaerae bacterium]